MPPKNRVKTYVDPDDIYGVDLNRQQDLPVVAQEQSGANPSWPIEGRNSFHGAHTPIANLATRTLDLHNEIDGSGQFSWLDCMLKITFLWYAAAADMPAGANEENGPAGSVVGYLWTGANGATPPLGAGDCFLQIIAGVYIYADSVAEDLRLYNNSGSTLHIVTDVEVIFRS